MFYDFASPVIYQVTDSSVAAITGGRHVEGEFLGAQQTVVVGIGGLELAQVVAVARDGARVELSAESTAAIQASRTHIDELAESGRAVYGVSTGFGALATRYIEPEQRARLQRSLVRSHAAGSGPCVETEVVRALMLLRLSTLATGRTGVRLDDRAGVRAAAQRAHHAVRARVRLAGLLGRPRAARSLRARGHGRGRGLRCERGTDARCRCTGRRGHRAGRTRREGGPRAHQRHRRHAGHAGARDGRPRGARACCRHRRRDERRGAARHRPQLRRRPRGAAGRTRDRRSRQAT